MFTKIENCLTVYIGAQNYFNRVHRRVKRKLKKITRAIKTVERVSIQTKILPKSGLHWSSPPPLAAEDERRWKIGDR
jgi:hypothetical protein